MDVKLHGQAIEVIELLHYFHIIGLCEFQLHLKIHEGLCEVGGELLDLHVEEGAVEFGFGVLGWRLLDALEKVEYTHILFS